MIIGTAGHVDHGKTSLVRALTGIDTDRLAEEKRRGITIELGFAHLLLPGGLQAGLVDVPGHERFVKTMAAGAGGVDMALLVVAADEGVMPQTREHLDICSLLDVRSGVVALTKADLLEGLGQEWRSMLEADIASLCQGTFLEGAKIIPVSAKSGSGLGQLKEALAEAAGAVAERSAEGPLFLPIDRAFSLKGFGTVVTGTLLSGQIALEEQVSLLPKLPGPLRVRGLQMHGNSVQSALAGSRIAVNLAGVEAAEIQRGSVLTRAGELPATRLLDVELSLLPAAQEPLPKRSKLLLHLGTDQVEATVALLEGASLAPGQKRLAQLRLAKPVAALVGQRFILRGFRPLPGRGATLAGGRIIGVSAPKRKAASKRLPTVLAEGSAEERLVWLLREAGYQGLTLQELFARSALPKKALARALELCGAKGSVLLVDKERRHYVSAQVLSELVARARLLLSEFHQQQPLKEGLPKEELRQRLGVASERIFDRAIDSLFSSKEVEVRGELVRERGHGPALSATEEQKSEQLLALLASAKLSPPTVSELSKALGLPGAKVLELLKLACAKGSCQKVTEELYFYGPALEELEARLIAYLRAHKEISTQAFKELVGQTRKFVIPLSEYFDRKKLTLRVGDKRVLRGA